MHLAYSRYFSHVSSSSVKGRAFLFSLHLALLTRGFHSLMAYVKAFSNLMRGRYFASNGRSGSYHISGKYDLLRLQGDADSGSRSTEQVSQPESIIPYILCLNQNMHVPLTRFELPFISDWIPQALVSVDRFCFAAAIARVSICWLPVLLTSDSFSIAEEPLVPVECWTMSCEEVGSAAWRKLSWGSGPGASSSIISSSLDSADELSVRSMVPNSIGWLSTAPVSVHQVSYIPVKVKKSFVFVPCESSRGSSASSSLWMYGTSHNRAP